MTARRVDPAQTTLFPTSIDPKVEVEKLQWKKQRGCHRYRCVVCDRLIPKDTFSYTKPIRSERLLAAIGKTFSCSLVDLQDRISSNIMWVVFIPIRVCSDGCLNQILVRPSLEIRGKVRRAESRHIKKILALLKRRLRSIAVEEVEVIA